MNSNYLLRLALRLAPIVVTGLLIAAVVPPDQYRTKRQLFADQRDRLQAITVGSSQNRSLHFASLGVHGMHFFFDQGDVEEGVHKAAILIDELPALEYVFMALSPGALKFSQRLSSDDYRTRRLLVSKDLPLTWNLPGYSIDEVVSMVLQRVFPVDHLQALSYSLVGYQMRASPLQLARQGPCYQALDAATREELKQVEVEEGIIDGYRRPLIKPQCIAAHAKVKARSHAELIATSLRAEPNLIRENIERLSSLAEQLHSQDAKLILVQPPLTRDYLNVPQRAYLRQDFYQAMHELSAHPAVEFLDFHDLYYDDVDDSLNTLFNDDGHLALVGAIRFSNTLRQVLQVRWSLDEHSPHRSESLATDQPAVIMPVMAPGNAKSPSGAAVQEESTS